MKKIAMLFSWFFHPIMAPLYGSVFYLLQSTYYYTNLQKCLILLQIGIITVLIPVVFFYFIRSFEKKDNEVTPNLSARKISLLFYGMLIYLLLSNTITESVLPELFYYFLGGLISIFVLLLLVLLKVNASKHLVGISALTTFVCALSLHYQTNTIPFIAVLVVLNGWLATSRLELKTNNYKEIIFGYLVGLVPQLVLTFFWL